MLIIVLTSRLYGTRKPVRCHAQHWHRALTNMYTWEIVGGVLCRQLLSGLFDIVVFVREKNRIWNLLEKTCLSQMTTPVRRTTRCIQQDAHSPCKGRMHTCTPFDWFFSHSLQNKMITYNKCTRRQPKPTCRPMHACLQFRASIIPRPGKHWPSFLQRDKSGLCIYM